MRLGLLSRLGHLGRLGLVGALSILAGPLNLGLRFMSRLRAMRTFSILARSLHLGLGFVIMVFGAFVALIKGAFSREDTNLSLDRPSNPVYLQLALILEVLATFCWIRLLVIVFLFSINVRVVQGRVTLAVGRPSQNCRSFEESKESQSVTPHCAR